MASLEGAKHPRGAKLQANKFIASTRALFDEAQRNSFISSEDVKFINGRVLDFITSTKGTNQPSPKYIHFPDGHTSTTLVAIPPDHLRINKANQKRLELTDSYIEFVGILRSIVTDKPSGWKDDWRNARSRRARLSTNSSTLSTDGDRPEGVEAETPELKIIPVTAESVAGEDDVLPEEEDCQSALMTPESAKSSYGQCDACSADSEAAPPNAESTRASSPQELDHLADNQQLDSIEPHASEDDSDHEYRPLDFEEEGAEEEDSPLTRMKKILPQLEEDIAKIPSQNWKKYEAALTKLVALPEIVTMDFSKRLHEIMRIIYLPEELEVIANRQWGRLGAVISICAVIVEATRSKDEEAEASLADAWVKSKIRDIVWLEKTLACN